MREQQQQTNQLSVAQVLAGALASVSAAVVASTFGLTGTLLGAAITSIVATVGGTLYKHSLERAHARVRVRIHRNPRTGVVTHEVLPATPPPRSLAWGALVGGAALAFLLALGALTAVEVVAKEPIARLLGRPAPPRAQTTIGGVLHDVTTAAPERNAWAPAPELTSTPAAVTPTRPATTTAPGQLAPTTTATVAPPRRPTSPSGQTPTAPAPPRTPTAPVSVPPAASPHR